MRKECLREKKLDETMKDTDMRMKKKRHFSCGSLSSELRQKKVAHLLPHTTVKRAKTIRCEESERKTLLRLIFSNGFSFDGNFGDQPSVGKKRIKCCMR